MAGKGKFEKGNPYRFKDGVSGNPSGRPKKKPISEAYERLVDEKIPKDHPLVSRLPILKGKTFAWAIAYGQIIAAIEGNTPPAAEIANRLEGKVKDEVELSGGFGLAVSEAYARARAKK